MHITVLTEKMDYLPLVKKLVDILVFMIDKLELQTEINKDLFAKFHQSLKKINSDGCQKVEIENDTTIMKQDNDIAEDVENKSQKIIRKYYK